MMLPPRSFLALLFTIFLAAPGAPAQVTLAEKDGQFHLARNGQPYFVKGGGGTTAVETLAAAGGNSIRTWGDDHLDEELARAQKLGLTVTAGIWLGQVRQGFDWSDADSLAKQMDHVRATVTKYKDSPALLIWALGNEMEDPQGKNAAVWMGIDQLARMVKQIDPNHPTMTVVAEIGGDKVKNFQRFCPSIDILGINSYGGAASLGERYRKAGGAKPYLLTEYGPAGFWEGQKTANGAYPEPTSTEKTAVYRHAYESAVLGQPALCLGSYAFLWGQKQEATATWFSMFLADGSRLGPVDAIQELWSGKPPANRCPAIASFKCDAPDICEPGATVNATLRATDPESDPLQVIWTLQRDLEEYGSGGDAEAAAAIVADAIVKSDLEHAVARLPKEPGLYRLFAEVHDNHGGAAVANLPIRVKGTVTVAVGKKATLPLVVYAEPESPQNYIPAGWMGDATAIKLDPACPDVPHTGKTCMRCDFTATKGWGGVVWQNPDHDWGDRGGGFDLTGAQRITFWARGAKGGEVVSFLFGIIPKEKHFFDTGSAHLDKVALTREWKQYTIDAHGQDLTRIKTGFVWTLASGGEPVTFYLDDIQWEGGS